MRTLFILLLIVCSISGLPSNPSVIVRLNRGGWDFLRDTVLNLMSRFLPQMPIPAGESFSKGLVKLTSKGGLIDDITLPRLNYTLKENGVTITMSGMYLRARVWFHAVLHAVFPITTNGWIGIKVNNLNAIGSVNLTVIDGRPRLVFNDCQNTLQEVKLDVHCRNSWAYSPFMNTFEKRAKGAVKRKVCDYMRKGIDQINAQLLSIPLQYQLGANFTLSYRINEMTFNSNFAEASASGTVLYGAERCLIEPEKVGKEKLPSSMGTIWASEQLVNCIFRSAHQGGIIQYTITKDVKEAAPVLRTRCPFKTNGICMGTFWPQLMEKYPNEYIDVHMHSFEEPTLKLTSGDARLHGSVLLDFYLNPMERTKESLATMKIISESLMVVRVNGTHLNGYLKDTKAEIQQVHSNIGDIEPSSITSFRNLFVSVEEILLNALMKQGIPIPVFKEAAMALAANSTINILNNFVRVDGNFIHQPNGSFSFLTTN